MSTPNSFRARWCRGLLAGCIAVVTSLGGCSEDEPLADIALGGAGDNAGPGGARSAGTGELSGGVGGRGESGAGGDAGAPGINEVAPYLVEASPPDGATNLYPSPLPSGVRIQLSFSAEMSTKPTEVTLRRLDGEERAVPIEWRPGGKDATVSITPNPLTGAQPLLDETNYALDLSRLTSARGALIDPDRELIEGQLRFTTGAFDALLNHACGHVQLGPFGEALAVATAGPSAVPTDMGHVNYTIHLSEGEAGYQGFTRVTTLAGRDYHFLLDRDVPLALSTDGSDEQPLAIESASAACAGITQRATFRSETEQQLFLRLGPVPERTLHLIVEVVSGG